MRKKNSLKNLITSFFPYVLVLLLGFVKVDVFLDTLGEEVYALNQLFFQLFAYISLAEAGASGYIIQLYYKHFANDNKETINAENTTLDIQNKLYNLMAEKGWYKTDIAEQVKINNTKQQFQNQ